MSAYRSFVAFVLTAVTSLASLAEPAGPPSVSASSREFIKSWLVCGAFPNPLAPGVTVYKHDENTLGYYIDYLTPIGGEAGVKPQAQLEFTASDGEKHAWRPYTSPTDLLDFCKVFEKNQKVVAYAACMIASDTEQDILLGLGSNDGVRAWMNGAMIWDNHRPRAAQADQDYVNAHVRRGANLLLLKVDQGTGAWGLIAHIVDRKEREARVLADTNPDLDAELKITPEALSVVYGRSSQYVFLSKLPTYTATLTPCGGKALESVTAPIGKPISFPRKGLVAGPYWVECAASLPSGATVSKKVFHFEGESPAEVRVYDKEGRPSEALVDLLDGEYKVIEHGTKPAGPGAVRLLRPDLNPFYLRILVEGPGLGKHWELADNGGKGFTCPKGGAMSIDLPLEAAKTAREKAQRTLSYGKDIPGWLRADLKERLRRAPLGRGHATPAQVFAVFETLGTTKASLPGSGTAAVWFAPGIEKVSRTEATPAIRTNAVHVALAQNEYEPFQLVVRPQTDLKNLAVTVEDAKSASGALLKGSDIAVLAENYVNVEKVTDTYGTEGPWPDALPALDAQTTAKAGENTPLWFTVHAPKGQAAGVYRGAVVVRAGGAVVARVPLEVTVFAFALPDETHTRTAYGVAVDKRFHGPITEAQTQQVHDLYMQFCAAHRISPYTPQANAEIAMKFEGSPAHPVLDYTKFDAAMTRYLDEFKFTSFNMGGLPGELAGQKRPSPEYTRLFKETYHAIQEHLREKHWLGKAYWYWVDEPIKNDYPDVKAGMELLREACPDIRRLLTCNQEDAPVPYFQGVVNLWVPIMDHYSPERAHARQALGEEVWWYVCTGPKAPYPNDFIDHPAINHRVRYWTMDTFGLDGDLYWSINYWEQNPWDQAMSIDPNGGPWGNGDGRLLYPPRRTKPTEPVIEGPVSSIRIENIRDGLEDREYLLKLAELGKTDKKAQALLDRVHRDTVRTLNCYDASPATLLAARYAAARGIAGK